MSLLFALGTRRITRLSETMKVRFPNKNDCQWLTARFKLVSKRHMTMLSGIRDFFYLRGDAQDYRDELAGQAGPAVPLLCAFDLLDKNLSC